MILPDFVAYRCVMSFTFDNEGHIWKSGMKLSKELTGAWTNMILEYPCAMKRTLHLPTDGDGYK
jgi:hypothetical protein